MRFARRDSTLTVVHLCDPKFSKLASGWRRRLISESTSASSMVVWGMDGKLHSWEAVPSQGSLFFA
jgi:hypothetical protein